MEENVTHLRSQKELVCIMEKASKEGHLPETILKEFAGRPFPMPALWACRDYFHQLDMETCRSHPALPPILALLSAMEGDLDKAKEYVLLLGETPRHWKPQDFHERDYYRISAELVMPYISDGMFLRIIFFLIKAGMVPVKSLTLSASRPSILNGFRDFTRFGPYLERYKDTISETVHQLYGSVGKNVYEILLAEWCYQNNDCFKALILVTGTIPLIEQESDMRCLFVALALQMRILLMNGQAGTAKPLVEKIRNRIHETGWEELTSSLNALECLAACYDGQQETIIEWLEKTAPDENGDIYMMDMFAWLVKVRCYLQTGKTWPPMCWSSSSSTFWSWESVLWIYASAICFWPSFTIKRAIRAACAMSLRQPWRWRKIPVYTAPFGRGQLHGADAVCLPAGKRSGCLYRPDY